MEEAGPALTLGALARGGKAALAAALSVLEERPFAADVAALLDAAHAAPRAHVTGITGPPGVGKSTLAGALIAKWRSRGRGVGVIAVDPSSRLSGGALLGDRIRIAAPARDEGVFVRSMAARDRLGGLSAATFAAMVLMRALYDRVLVETVGVGQSETDIAQAADTVVFCVQPASGDSLQFMKAGIMELPEIVAVTKADLGAPARRAVADVEAALALAARGPADWRPRVLPVSAQSGEGVEELDAAIAAHRAWLGEQGRLGGRRHAQAQTWLGESLGEELGRRGLAAAGEALELTEGTGPFGRLRDLLARLTLG